MQLPPAQANATANADAIGDWRESSMERSFQASEPSYRSLSDEEDVSQWIKDNRSGAIAHFQASFGARPPSPTFSDEASVAPSETDNFLRQTIERPITESFTHKELAPYHGPAKEVPPTSSNTSGGVGLLGLFSTRSFLAAFFISLFCASAFAIYPLLLDNNDDSSLLIDFSPLVNVQGEIAHTFNGGGAGSSDLAYKIQKAELATSDLIMAVLWSGLQSSDIMAEELSGFVEDAKNTGQSLLELDTKARGTVDKLMLIDAHMLRAIGNASQKKPSPLSQLLRKDKTTTIIARKFKELMSIESEALADLVELATNAYTELNRLKERLQNLRDVARLEKIALTEEHEEILSSIWTFFGANRVEIRTFETNFELLNSIGGYTDEAMVRVGDALFNLKTMQAQLKDLRERATLPAIIGDAVPIEVHVMVMDEGLKRLKGLAGKNVQDIRTIRAGEDMV